MGTKKPIVSHVVEVIESAKAGPVLDLFAGISSIGMAVAPKRNVWCNDVQNFAVSLAGAKFTSKTTPHFDAATLSKLMQSMAINRQKLEPLVGYWVQEEDISLKQGKIRALKDLCERQIAATTGRKFEAIRLDQRQQRDGQPCCLFSISYIGGYFGSRQARDIDCLRFAFDQLLANRHIDRDQHRWFCIALCKSLFAVAHTTGHFAQYLEVKTKTLDRFLKRRRRDVFTEWAKAVAELGPVGSAKWRLGNKVYKGEAVRLLGRLKNSHSQPSIIYADPPYTSDQYSRYYHILETLIRYDYPAIVGKGQYRPDRFVSDFSLQSKVASAFDKLIFNAAEIGADFILNYPATGLLTDTRQTLLRTLRNYFQHAEVAAAIPHQHSTLGGSKGIESAPVTELIFYAR
jgi:adenine-specific DNA-methyltransferase